jgi:AcrR family transcriptional regulator
MRADARRNREKILVAAEEVFGMQGTAASTDDVARTAGVGIGTVFRHFPTKEALLEEIYVVRLRRLIDEADELAGAPDPGSAFFGFFTRLVEQSATKNAYAQALAEAGIDVKETGRELLRSLGGLLARAQQAGAVRPDVGVPELIALLIGASRAAEHASADPLVRDRTIMILLDGLRHGRP